MILSHQGPGFGPELGDFTELILFQDFEGCTKTNGANATQFIHLEPIYIFELSKFNELFSVMYGVDVMRWT